MVWLLPSIFKVNEYEKHMLHKKLIYIVLIVSFIACSSKNPGMNKDEIVRTLDEQAMQHETAVKAASAAMPEVTEDYTPPAGIKYRAKIETVGVKTLNVQAALKNVRSMKVSELGTLHIHRTGALVPMGGSLISVDEGYLLNSYQGIYLLDKDFKLIKQLFKNDVEFQRNGKRFFFQLNALLQSVYYNATHKQVQGAYTVYKHERNSSRTFLAFLPWDVLTAATEPLIEKDITSSVPLQGNLGHRVLFKFTTEGFMRGIPYSSRFYTNELKGDTLCYFDPTHLPDYAPSGRSGSVRSGEPWNIYDYQGKTRIRLAYDNTLYQLENASTLKAIYRLDFGSLQRAVGQKVIGGSNVDDFYFVDQWLETDRYLFIRLTKGYDSPNARKAKSVSLYSLIYDKTSGNFFSLPHEADKVELDFPCFPADGEQNVSFYPKGAVGNILFTCLDAMNMKDKYPDALKGQDVPDDELIVLTIE